MPRTKTAAKTSRASSSPKKAQYAGSEKRLAVGSLELRKLISRKQKARWRRYFAEHPEAPRKPRPARLPHDEVHERRAVKHRKAVVGISARTGERLRFPSMLEAAKHHFVQGETSSVVAAQLIISQVCNGRRSSGFGSSWEFPHRGRPMTLATRKGRAWAKTGRARRENSPPQPPRFLVQYAPSPLMGCKPPVSLWRCGAEPVERSALAFSRTAHEKDNRLH